MFNLSFKTPAQQCVTITSKITEVNNPSRELGFYTQRSLLDYSKSKSCGEEVNDSQDSVIQVLEAF